MHPSEIAALHMEAQCTSSNLEAFFDHRRDKSVLLPRATGKSVDAEALGSFGNRYCLSVNEMLKDEIQKAKLFFLKMRCQPVISLNYFPIIYAFIKECILMQMSWSCANIGFF